MQRLIIVGNVGKDPIEAYSQSGTRSVQFSVATKEVYYDKDKQKKEVTTWFRCNAYNTNGDNILKYVKQGNKVCIEGKISTYEYEKNNQKQFGWSVIVERIEFLSSPSASDRKVNEPQKKFDDNSAWGGTSFNQENFDFNADDIPF